jgi:hypothetical protein
MCILMFSCRPERVECCDCERFCCDRVTSMISWTRSPCKYAFGETDWVG